MSALGSENEHQTLYTDETRKQGETFASFITTDENRKSVFTWIETHGK
jgi:hypothetical protein